MEQVRLIVCRDCKKESIHIVKQPSGSCCDHCGSARVGIKWLHGKEAEDAREQVSRN